MENNSIKKVFISQPMRDLTDEEIIENRKNMEEDLKNYFDCEYTIIDSFFQGAPVDARPLWFIGRSIELLSTADVIYMGKGWEKARGCVIEHDCAAAYGIPILFHSTDRK